MMWKFADIWNKSLLASEPRVVAPRDYIYASELGSAMIDTWLKMKGVQFSNPTSARSLRKFEVGHFIEWMVSMVLRRAGILREAQLRAELPATTETVRVSGRLDFIAGGQIDVEGSLDDLAGLELPKGFSRALQNIIMDLNGQTLEQKILEIKSASLTVFNGFLSKKMRPQHSLQAAHYSRCLNLPASVAYVCKDDLRIVEFDAPVDDRTLQEYDTYLKTISGYYLNNEKPPIEKPILFDTENYRFYKNWRVAYSNYLTMLYGFKNEDAFDVATKDSIRSWNYTWTRIVEEKDMTKNNLEVIEEFKQLVPNYSEYIAPARELKRLQKEVPVES